MQRGTHHSENNRYQRFVYEDVFEPVLPGLGRDTATEGVCAASHTFERGPVCQHELCNFQEFHVRNQEYARIDSAGQEERNVPFSCDISLLYHALMISTVGELWGPVEGQWKEKNKPPLVHVRAPPVLLAIRG